MIPRSTRHFPKRLLSYTVSKAIQQPKPSDFARSQSRIFKISPEVEEATWSKKPVVALESTIYTHGFPYPDNVGLASHLESVVRLNGGIPATIGVLNGIARVGLTPEELIELASAAGKKETMKISRRDLPYITGLGISGKKIHGGTTIAGTMILAKLARIPIIGTGGLGGVHRGGEVTMDISADLTELGRTPVTVISSGCKSFLDIPRTLEYLETQGVTVATFADGRKGAIDLPAFWTRESGVKSPAVVHDEKEVAEILYSRDLLKFRSGSFFANPIPEEHSIPKSEIDQAIEEAVQDAERQGISGHANTPFVLARIKEITGGKSIPANRALIESNVARATKVAVELSKLRLLLENDAKTFMPQSSISTISSGIQTSEEAACALGQGVSPVNLAKPTNSSVRILVAGSVALDLACDYAPLDSSPPILPLMQTSNPAIITQSIGGVGHNIATAAHLVGGRHSAYLCSLIVDDLAGRMILSSLRGRGLDTGGIEILKESHTSKRTAQYVAINDKSKNLVIAAADMNIIGSSQVNFNMWRQSLGKFKPKWVVLDANWHETMMRTWIQSAKDVGAKVAIEPVSVAKSARLFPPANSSAHFLLHHVYPNNLVDIATPNIHELHALNSAAKANGYFESPQWQEVTERIRTNDPRNKEQIEKVVQSGAISKDALQQVIELLPYIPTVITKLGSKGLLVASISFPSILTPNLNLHIRLHSPEMPIPETSIISVNGAGDTLLGILVSGLSRGLSATNPALLSLAQKGAAETLQSNESVNPRLGHLQSELDALVTSKYGIETRKFSRR